MHRRLASLSLAFLAAFTGVLLPACGDGSTTTVITDVRTFDAPRATVPPNAPTWHRFGMDPPRDAGAQAPELGWDLPPGWKHAPTASRPYNFVLEGDAEVDAYLSALPRRQNTIADNVNRWREQMGLAPLEPAAVDALPKEPLFGDRATFVDLEGSYTPMMSGDEPRADWRMLGLILDAERMFVFFKMVGPKATLEKEREAFLSLAASFRRETAPATPAHGGTTPGSARKSSLTWTVPEGWKSEGAQGMREVTFTVEGTPASCWVLFLGGTAGGLKANVDRWLGELGQPALDEAGVAALDRLDVLGTQGVFVEGEGNYRGMGGPATEGATLYGLVCPLAGRTLFVKMVGPTEVMRDQRAKFRAFCESLAFKD